MGQADPTAALSERLHSLWVEGLVKGHITDNQANKTVGIYRKGKKITKSTSDIFKPGLPYGYALLKVHKLDVEQIKAKIIPPARFVTDLSRGLTVRSDRFLAWKWVMEFSVDFASDLVRDSTQALRILESFSVKDDNNNEVNSHYISNTMASFSFDVVSLYDSLSPDLVLRAFRFAAESLRDWSDELITWISNLIALSFDASFLYFRGNFYIGKVGIATGATLSVDLANITVKYALDRVFARSTFFSANVLMFARFVDDGVGILKEGADTFKDWMLEVNSFAEANFNLKFTYDLNPIYEWSTFLDIKFKYVDGKLSTDINRKLTDACRYLEFSSCHPPHTFRNIVYGQGRRYQRIINNDTTLEVRLRELREFFIFSSYDSKLVDDALDRVRSTPRSLEYKVKTNDEDSGTVFWTVSYGPGYGEARQKGTQINQMLASSYDGNLNNIKLRVVPRRGPNLKDILFKRKAFSVSNVNRNIPNVNPIRNTPCGRPRCKACNLITDLKIGNNSVKSEGGSCTTQNCIYMAQCQKCLVLNHNNNLYIGKTTTMLSVRITGHRAAYSQLNTFSNVENINDKNCLWAHTRNAHGSVDRAEFEDAFRFCILKVCDPRDLRINEQFFIDKYRTLFPHGLNSVNSIL